jgi:hypothetical protein
MGGGSYSADTYARTTGAKVNTGTTFDYDRKVRSTGIRKAHETLDPKVTNAEGLNIRESRDSVEHPNSVPIVVGFDVTGSMGTVPRVAQVKLAGLFGLLLRKGYVEDPQICISAYGDAYTDSVPLQISQFESDNRVDDALDKLFLEGNGGGNNGETQTLLWYYMARHMVTDSWDKRHKKGYLFVIADERALDLKPEHISKFIGDEEPPASDLTAEALVKEVQKKWEVIILLINNGTAQYQGSEEHYKKLVGKNNVLVVEDPNSIAETIGLAVGVKEGTVDSLDQAEDDLKENGFNAVAIRSALDSVGGLIGLSGSGVVAKGDLNLDLGTTTKSTRL